MEPLGLGPSMSSTAAASRSAFRPTLMTEAPAATSPAATPLPIPLPPPVTRYVRPSKESCTPVIQSCDHAGIPQWSGITASEDVPAAALRFVPASYFRRLGAAPVLDVGRQSDRESVLVVRRPVRVTQFVNMERVAQRLGESHRIRGSIDRILDQQRGHR